MKNLFSNQTKQKRLFNTQSKLEIARGKVGGAKLVMVNKRYIFPLI